MLPIPWDVMPSGLHRTYGADHLHFITCSCYRRLPFLKLARSRDRFLSILEQTRQRYRFVVVGYVVMPEHIPLLITEPEMGNPSKVMQVLKQTLGARVAGGWPILLNPDSSRGCPTIPALLAGGWALARSSLSASVRSI